MAEPRSGPLTLPPPPAPPTEGGRPPARRRVRRGRTRRYGRPPEGSSVPFGRKFSLLLLFAIAQGLFLFSSLFRLSHLEVHGNQRLTDQQIVEQARIAPGSWLWSLSPSSLEARLRQVREVHSARVGLGIPGRVVLTVRERDPVMQVASADHPQDWFEVDAEGVLLGPVRGTSPLPRLHLAGAFPSAGKLDPTPVLVALKARSWLEPVLPGRIAGYEVDDLQAVSVRTTFLGTPVVVRVGPLQSMDYKMHILRAIFDRLKSEKRQVASVDLRFSSPVVRPLRPEPEPSPEP